MSPVLNSFTVLATCYLLTFTVPVISLDLYTNQWAVEVDGGEVAANEIARKHGFNNLGQIGSLKDHYLFEHREVFKRSLEANRHHHTRLKRETKVLWSEQQIIKKRVKRGFTESNIKDPLWATQWYLHGGSTGGYDMNVLPAWAQGVTGKGVVVTILDDGIDRTHPDLVANYDPYASFDVNSNDRDPMPRPTSSDENRHGTRCAGEVSAGLNSYCGIGVAYNAKIGGVRMLDGDVTDAVEAKSLSYNISHIDIYSASWGPDDDGKVVDGPGPLAKKAFIDGVAKGRQGKGSIFVWASGNGGAMKDSCACDGYSNSIYTLSISSTSEHGRKPWYLEECASTLATTFSSGENYRERQIVTTDLHHGCTQTHTGTSASAPLAAGLVALALEVNPTLTWRDTQYIVLMTSRSEPMTDGEFKMNGVGRRVSHRYGYGLMDANGMVQLARNWTSVPEKFICEEPAVTVPMDIPRNVSVNITSTGCEGTSNAVKFLEHVQLKVTMRFPHRGDASVVLKSARRTESTVLPRRQNDYNNGEYHDWPLLSVFFWGEDPKGTWTVDFLNTGYGRNKGVVKSYQLILHGTQVDPVRLRSATSQQATTTTATQTTIAEETTTTTTQAATTTATSSEEASTIAQTTPKKGSKPGDFGDTDDNETTEKGPAKNKGKIKCHPECDGECNGTLASQCKQCKHFKLSGSCVESCPLEGYTINADTHECVKIECHPSCKTCSGPSDLECLSCADHVYWDEDKSLCVPVCDSGYYADEQNVCKACGDTCRACAETASHCIDCHPGKTLVDNACVVADCYPSEYLTDEGCKPCSAGCHNCTGPDIGQCLQCVKDMFFVNGSCVSDCAMEGYYEDRLDDMWACRRCPSTCRTCSGGGETDCDTCNGGFTFSAGACVAMTTPSTTTTAASTECKEDEFRDAFDDCMKCHEFCRTCTGATLWDCLECATGWYMHHGKCSDTCPDGYFPETHSSPAGAVVGQCKECHVTCGTCSGPGINQCNACKEGFDLENGACVSSCPRGEFRDFTDTCVFCDSSCVECSGSSDSDCLECDAFVFLHEGKCMDACPDGYYGNEEKHCQECDVSCHTCSGGSSNQCTTCTGELQLSNGACLTSHVACAGGQYYSTEAQSCSMCDVSCRECNAGSRFNCTACDEESALTNGECVFSALDGKQHNTEGEPVSTPSPVHTQRPAPPGSPDFNEPSDEEEPSDVEPSDMSNHTPTFNERPISIEDHARIRTASTINVDNGKYRMETPPLQQEPESKSTYGVVVVIVICCVAVTILFFVVFGVLQARSSGKWCFRSVGYQKVPTLYDRAQDRVLLTSHDFDDEDEIF